MCPFLTVDPYILQFSNHDLVWNFRQLHHAESWDYTARRILRSKECTLCVKVMSVRLWSTVAEAKPSGAFFWYSTWLNKSCAIPILVKHRNKKVTQGLRLRPTCVSAPISSVYMFTGAKNIASKSCREKKYTSCPTNFSVHVTGFCDNERYVLSETQKACFPTAYGLMNTSCPTDAAVRLLFNFCEELTSVRNLYALHF